MYLSQRSVLPALVCAGASFFFAACQTSREQPSTEPVQVEDASLPTASASPVGDLPDESQQEQRLEVAETVELPAERARPARTLEEQARRYGAQIERLPGSKEWQVSDGEHSVVLTESSRIAKVDGVVVFLDSPFKQKRGKWILGASDERIIFGSVFGTRSKPVRPVRTIAIDPGHGGGENGTRNDTLGLLEKELNLDVSQRLQGHLEKLGFKTVLTRYDDRMVPLEQRPEIAKGAKADLFISIHFNAAANREASGLETYVLTAAGEASSSGSEADEDAIEHPGNRCDLESFGLGLLVQKSLVSRLNRTDRGLKKARFRVLTTLECPGVLVECGFLSQDDEALLASTAGYRERVALALTDAIVKYAGEEASEE